MKTSKRNLIAQGQSGVGKSIACIAAIMNHVDVAKRYPQALYLLPTHESVGQETSSIYKVVDSTDVRILFADQDKDGELLSNK